MSFKVYIISPHIDDAAYGLTLHIAGFVKHNLQVTLINCFTVTRWTAVPVKSKEIKDVMQLRLQEDREYHKLFDMAIESVNLDLLDAPLRNGYIFQFQPLLPDEWDLVHQLQNYFSSTTPNILLCPLALGNHIDHVICLEAGLQLYKKVQILFYEDLPYASRISADDIQSHIQQLENRLAKRLTNRIYDLNNWSIDKCTAIKLYKTQMNEEICSEILSYMHLLGGERLWGEESLLEELQKQLC